MGGCRIETEHEFRVGTQARVEVSFTVNGLVFRFNGIAQWTDGKRLVGIRFVDLTLRRRDELAELLCEVEQQNAAREAERAAKAKAAEEEAARQRELAEQLAQLEAAAEALPMPDLAAPRDCSNLIAGAGASAVPVAGEDQPPKPVKRERRAQSRHEVDTSAEIYLVNVGSRLHGRIHDLSLGGCRIRTDEKFPVGIYTRVETEFRLGGLPFRLGGVIQAVHDRDRLNIGIRFLDMSDRKRAQVAQLIEEIEEMRKSEPWGGPHGSAGEALGA
jgi:hypothetical protein